MSLRVVQLLPDLEVGGVERGTIEIAKALVAAGHRAIVISNPGRLVAELDACGAEHIPLSIGRKSLTSLALIPKLRRIFSERRIEIVHARSRLPAWLGHLAIRGMPTATRPQWITTVHGPYTVNRYSKIMTSGDRIIAISNFIKDYIETNYPNVSANRISVVPRGIDQSVFYPSYKPDERWLSQWHSRFPELQGRRLLLMPGRLTRWKGQLSFIRLVKILLDAGESVHGLIAGGDSDPGQVFLKELQRAAAAADVSEHISFLGRRDDFRELMSIAEVSFSLTSEPEAFGRTTIEALSLGTPVVGFDHGGTGEILKAVFPQGLVRVGDMDAAAEMTKKCLLSTSRPQSDHHFTLRRMQEATLSIYENLATSDRS